MARISSEETQSLLMACCWREVTSQGLDLIDNEVRQCSDNEDDWRGLEQISVSRRGRSPWFLVDLGFAGSLMGPMVVDVRRRRSLASREEVEWPVINGEETCGGCASCCSQGQMKKETLVQVPVAYLFVSGGCLRL